MKKVLSNNIATGVRQPYTKVTHEWYNAMITEATEALGKGLLGVNSNFVVLHGCVNSDAPDADISAGAIFYNGEIYLCPAFVDTTISNDIVGTITTAYDALDPVLFSDGNSYNVHQVKTIVWSDAASGSGDIDYADLAFQTGTVKTVIPFTAWNMDTTATFTVTTTIDITKITSVGVMISNNAGTLVTPLIIPNVVSASDFPQTDGAFDLSAGTVTLRRRTGGFYDAAGYNAALGFVTIEAML